MTPIRQQLLYFEAHHHVGHLTRKGATEARRVDGFGPDQHGGTAERQCRTRARWRRRRAAVHGIDVRPSYLPPPPSLPHTILTPPSYPLITLSTRAQVESKRAQSSTLNAARLIIKREGIAGLYAGLESALFGISVTNFVYYYWYEWTRSGFEKAALKAGRASAKLTTIESMIAGAIAGSATVLITNPIWVINTRMTARKGEEEGLPGAPKQKAPSTLGTLLALLREEGPARLFAGVMPALVLVINPILQYTVFEQFKQMLEKKRRVTPKDAFALGALGKLLATSITYPYITVKSRMHVAGKDAERENMLQTFTRIVNEEGWKGLYGGKTLRRESGREVLIVGSGIGPKVTQSVITAAFLFAFKDALYGYTIAARKKIAQR